MVDKRRVVSQERSNIQAHIGYLRERLDAVSDGDLDEEQQRNLRTISRFVAALIKKD